MTTTTTTTTEAKMMVLDFSTEGRGAGRVAVPAGRYYLGDPCYPFPNSGPHEAHWMPLLRSCGYFGATGEDEAEENGHPSPVGTVTVEGVTYEVLGFGTQYGDGGYPGSDGFEYPVDAGLIGLVPMALVEAMGGDMEWLLGATGYKGVGCGTVIDSAAGFLCERSEDGTLMFGTVSIETGDAAEDEDDKCSECYDAHCPGAWGDTCCLDDTDTEDEDEDE